VFTGFVASAFIWNLALFVAAPFFNVFLVQQFQTNTAVIGLLTAVSSLTALFGQRVFGPLLDRKSNVWVQIVCGFTIPILPFAWVFITASWQVAVINAFGGFIWAGYLLSNFNLLLKLAPDEQRLRAVALYQTAVFSSAFFGPILGGYLAETTSFQFIFGISAAGRLLAMIVFAAFAFRMPKQQLQPITSK
jgi:MFS family permease